MTYNISMQWKPPKSPHGLIQEDLWPDEWKILVACLLLNLTTRKQVDGVIYRLFDEYPDPSALMEADLQDLQDLIKPLGMWRKRAKTLKRFSKEYLSGEWGEAKDLYGCGKYADDSWKIFCRGSWRDVEPNDHALNMYHDYLMGASEEKNSA
jgi:methyl-CpG-binding domain protein 4